MPRPDHVVVLVLENHGFDEVIGQPSAAFLNSLANSGTLLTNSYAVTHPSEPNYLALFSGSTQGLTSDACPVSYSGPNLAQALLNARLSFVGYSEDLPHPGFTGCSAGSYARKHNPWVDFPQLPASVNQPMGAFPQDYRQLPSVAFVVPNLDHDMHDGTVAQADAWARATLGGYAAWARSHNSLLIVTCDEDDGSADNRVATVIAGAHVMAGRNGQHVTHYVLLRTLGDLVGLSTVGRGAQAAPITGIWTG